MRESLQTILLYFEDTSVRGAPVHWHLSRTGITTNSRGAQSVQVVTFQSLQSSSPKRFSRLHVVDAPPPLGAMLALWGGKIQQDIFGVRRFVPIYALRGEQVRSMWVL